jgi:cytosine permease
LGDADDRRRRDVSRRRDSLPGSHFQLRKAGDIMSGQPNSGIVHQTEEQIDDLLGHEFEHEPVPMSARRSAFSVTMVWLGFPMIITGAMTGSLLVLGMGFKNALVAMIIGNLIMFA